MPADGRDNWLGSRRGLCRMLPCRETLVPHSNQHVRQGGGNGQSSSYCAPYSVQYMGWAPGFLVPLTHSFLARTAPECLASWRSTLNHFRNPLGDGFRCFPKSPLKIHFLKASWGTLPSTCCLCYQKVLFDYLIAVFVFVCMFVRMLERNMQR